MTRSLDDLLQACVDTHCLFGSACFVPESSFWLGKASIVTTSIATLFTTNATDFLQFDVNQKLKKKILVILRFTRDLYHAIK
ncbi:hypothetical protein [Vibrio sp. J502]|uniref:hypothetical protein n=1 Tax=Vibrio sp. J502 TaxID=2978741 RepID=UPI0021BF7FEE|nr:hypothetical protein [Vibrio sp. J502]UXH28325.1 hypothetical protein N5E84_15440 [Vibrio sp. J502]